MLCTTASTTVSPAGNLLGSIVTDWLPWWRGRITEEALSVGKSPSVVVHPCTSGTVLALTLLSGALRVDPPHQLVDLLWSKNDQPSQSCHRIPTTRRVCAVVGVNVAGDPGQPRA